jgi:hypothetical protein
MAAECGGLARIELAAFGGRDRGLQLRVLGVEDWALAQPISSVVAKGSRDRAVEERRVMACSIAGSG